MSIYGFGDFVKTELMDDQTGACEWVWIRVEYCDEKNRLVFGWLDSQPILALGERLKLGSHLAVEFDRLRDHKSPSEFQQL